jgi:hypothetical protein
LKKIIAIFLLVVLLFNCAGGLWIFKFQQQFNYWQVQQELESSQHLAVLNLNIDDYEKSKTGENEISLNGKMYDISSAFVKGNMVLLVCMEDLAEDNLIDSFNEQDEKKSKQGGSDLQLLKFLSLVYIETRQIHTLHFSDADKLYFSAYNRFYSPTVIAVESPPPKAL